MTVEASVRFIRLNNGEDIIANAYFVPQKDSEEAYYIINNPMKVIYFPTGHKAGMSISLMHWVFTKISENQEFNISKRDVLVASEPSKSLIDFYEHTLDLFNKDKNTELEFSDEVPDEEEYGEEISMESEESMEMLKNLVEQLKMNKKTYH